MSAQDDFSGDAPSASDLNLMPTMSMDTADSAERVIGRYHLVRRLGEGGMGEVWLAEQKEPVRRRVALKLIKTGLTTSEAIARFDSERQVLALMDHPAIAKVFDADATAQGTPYFVMEYVAGVPITDYCDNHRLSTRERLELLMQVCEGVQHAHQKAIIHRDLKPSNILVANIDGKPLPKIIDFGVAKALSQKLTMQTLFTRVGALVGTPEYMSPEQASSTGEDVDTRTDVYSLGIIFYELLAGAPPIELRAIALEEFLRRLRQDEPLKPSTRISKSDPGLSTDVAQKRQTDRQALVKQLRGDLDSIALKALEKERSRRYASASEFAADIKRYLKNEPVLAVPPSVPYRSRKFVRRHRLVVATSAVIAIAVAVLIVSLVVGSARIARERDRANREAQAAERVSDFLIQAFSVSDPDEARGNKITAREVLDNGAHRIETELTGQPSLQARLMFTMGRVYEGLGLYEPARQLVDKAVRLQESVLGPDDKETLNSRRLLARILEYQGNFSEAEKLYLETIHRQERIFGPEAIDTLRTRNNLGTLYNEQGRYADAEKLLSNVVDDLTRVSGRDNSDTLSSLHSLAITYDGERQYEKEAALWEELYRVRSQKLGPDHPDTLNSLQNLAYVYYRQGKNAEAEKLQRQGLEIGQRVLGNDHPSVLLALGNLANTLLQEGKLDEAEQLQSQALEGRRRMMGPNHPETQFAIANLANVLVAQKRYKEAERLYREALEGEIKALGDNHPEIAFAWYNLATVEAAQGNRAKALLDLHKAIDHGYNDPDEIAQDSSWKAMRGDADYQEAFSLIKSHRVKSTARD